MLRRSFLKNFFLYFHSAEVEPKKYADGLLPLVIRVMECDGGHCRRWLLYHNGVYWISLKMSKVSKVKEENS